MIKYEYSNALYRGDYVKPDILDHEMILINFFPDQELFVLLLWMYRKTILKHLLHLHIIFFLWMRQGGAFASHKSLTRIIWAKETADGAVSFKFLANYSSSPHELPSGKPEMRGDLMEMTAFLCGKWCLPTIRSLLLRLSHHMVFDVYLRLFSHVLALSTLLPFFTSFFPTISNFPTWRTVSLPRQK